MGQLIFKSGSQHKYPGSAHGAWSRGCTHAKVLFLQTGLARHACSYCRCDFPTVGLAAEKGAAAIMEIVICVMQKLQGKENYIRTSRSCISLNICFHCYLNVMKMSIAAFFFFLQGGAQISLAETFKSGERSTRWYNLLSYKYLQAQSKNKQDAVCSKLPCTEKMVITYEWRCFAEATLG